MIIIDYYNFLYTRYPEINESVIVYNLHVLSYFVKNKDVKIKIIFDGIYFQNINFTHKKIQLFFTSYITADDYIIHLFSQLQGKSHILISKDRKLINLVKQKSNITVLSPHLFWKELDFLVKYTDTTQKHTDLIKTSEDNDTEIDLLYYNYFNKKKW